VGASIREGVSLGVAAGLAFFGVEELINFAAAQPALTWGEALTLAPFYAVIAGAGAGGSASLGRSRVLCGWGAWAALAAFLVGGKVAHVLNDRGLPGSSGFVAALVGVVGGLAVLELVARRLPDRLAERVVAAGLVTAWVAMVGGLTLNLAVLGAMLSPEALTADAIILVCSATVGALSFRFLPVERLLAASWAVAALSWALRVPVAVLAAPALPLGSSVQAPPILLVVVDTLRGDRLGYAGYEQPTSPNLDAVADEGVAYLAAQSAAPWTLPSFGSLLTGQLPGQHGAGVNPGDGNLESGLAASVPTLAELLEGAGYATAALVSNAYLKRLFGLDRGFDSYDDALGMGHTPLVLQPLDELGVIVLPDRFYTPADRMADKALATLDALDGGAWFLLLHFMDPHGPYLPPEELVQRMGTTSHDPVEKLYDAEIAFMDRELGRVLDALPADAWVFVTSDHGEEMGEHAGAYPDEPIPDDSRHGHTQYQELLHVPLLVRPPGGTKARRIERPVRSLDLVPTVLEIAGLPAPEGLAGVPLSEALGGEGRDEPAVSEAIRYGTERKAVRDGRWKLVAHADQLELYDLEADPREQRDVSRSHSAVVARLSAWLPGASEAGEAAEVDDALREQLEALGYVGD